MKTNLVQPRVLDALQLATRPELGSFFFRACVSARSASSSSSFAPKPRQYVGPSKTHEPKRVELRSRSSKKSTDVSQHNPIRAPSNPTATQPLANTSPQTSAPNSIDSPKTNDHRIQPPFTSLINPPPSVRPPLLEPASIPVGASQASRLWARSKPYLKFYRTALKSIYQNYKTSSKLQRERIRRPHLSLDDVQSLAQQGRSSGTSGGSLENAVLAGNLSRAEYQFCLRTSQDVKRLPMFGLMYMLIGELTALVVVKVNDAVPRTAWIPKQVSRNREKFEERRVEARKRGEGVSSLAEIFAEETGRDNTLMKRAALHLGLYGAFWDTWFFDKVVGGPAMWVVRRRYERRKREIRADDVAIRRDGGLKGSAWDEEEVQMACEQRGIDLVGKEGKTSSALMDLRTWLDRRWGGDVTPDHGDETERGEKSIV